MSKYYSVLEEHVGPSWWYHKNWTFDTREKAEEFAKKFSESFNNRPTMIYEHDKPLPNETLEYLDNNTFGFAGLIRWKNGKDVTKEYKGYYK